MSAPSVELRFNPTDLRPRDLPSAGAFLGSPADALEAALAVARAEMRDRMMQEVRGIADPTKAQLLRIADLAWQAAFWNFRKVSAPVLADAYVRAYRRAEAGDVPMSVLYNLADKHAEKIGDYFHATSRDALSQGFSSMVNRQLPAKAAANKALEAWGLSPRQMRAYAAAKQLQTPIDSPVSMAVKARIKAYVDKAFTSRTRKLSRQEEHNIEEQAKQYAWMWLQDKGRLSKKAQKMWVTAKDERVCPICGPLHGKKVGVNERFVTAQGEFWTPGLHPNCRCEVRLIENKFSKDLAGTELKEFNRLHPRANDGRFGVKTRTKTIDVDEEFARITAPSRAPARTQDAQLQALFQDVVRGSVHQQAIAKPAITRGKVQVVGAKAKPAVATAKPKVIVEKPRVQARIIAAQVMSPQAKTEFTTKLAAKLKTVPDTSVRTVRQGTKSPGQPVGKTVYHVVSRQQFKNPARIELDQGMEFTSDRLTAADTASALVSDDVEELVYRIKKQGASFSDFMKSGDRFQLTEQQVRDVVSYYARKGTGSSEIATEPIPLSEAPIFRVAQLDIEGRPLLDEKGEPMHSNFSVDYLGKKFDVHSDYFDVRIIAVREGHVGQTHPEFLSDEKPESWSFEGMFRVKPSTIQRTDDLDFNVTMMEIEPVRETKKPD